MSELIRFLFEKINLNGKVGRNKNKNKEIHTSAFYGCDCSEISLCALLCGVSTCALWQTIRRYDNE